MLQGQRGGVGRRRLCTGILRIAASGALLHRDGVQNFKLLLPHLLYFVWRQNFDRSYVINKFPAEKPARTTKSNHVIARRALPMSMHKL